MKNKNRNKKYNKMKGALAMARAGLKNLGIWHDEKPAEYTSEVINYKTGRSIPVGLSMVHAITNTRHHWNVNLIVIGFESNGKKRIDIDVHHIPVEVYHTDLVDYLNDEHKHLAAVFSERNTLTNVAWLAVPNGVEVSEEDIWSIVERKDAW